MFFLLDGCVGAALYDLLWWPVRKEYAADNIVRSAAYFSVLVPCFIFEHVAFLPYFVLGGFHVSFYVSWNF